LLSFDLDHVMRYGVGVQPPLPAGMDLESGRMMRTTLGLLCVAGLALTGCGRTLHSVATMAENTRTATEHLVSASEASNAQKEVEIFPDASSLRTTPPLKLSERYEMRDGPDGFMVYDTENHTIARIGSQTQTGLTLDQAQKASEALGWASDHHETAGELPPPPPASPGSR
jgi:hypothetical protein